MRLDRCLDDHHVADEPLLAPGLGDGGRGRPGAFEDESHVGGLQRVVLGERGAERRQPHGRGSEGDDEGEDQYDEANGHEQETDSTERISH